MNKGFCLTHIRLVLECKLTTRPPAVEVSRLLVSVDAVIGFTVLCTSEPEEAFTLYCIVLPVVIEVHLDVRGADVDLVAAVTLDAVVVGLLLVMGAVHELVTAVVHGGHSPEAVLESLVHLLMPLAVANHFFLLCKIFSLAHGHSAVEVLAIIHVFAGIEATFKA